MHPWQVYRPMISGNYVYLCGHRCSSDRNTVITSKCSVSSFTFNLLYLRPQAIGEVLLPDSITYTKYLLPTVYNNYIVILFPS